MSLVQVALTSDVMIERLRKYHVIMWRRDDASSHINKCERLIREAVENALEEKDFLNHLREADPLNIHFGERLVISHPAVIEIVVLIFYQSASGVARRFPLNFMGNMFPLPALAAILVIIEVVIREWATGKHQLIALNSSHQTAYDQWIQALKRFEADSYHAPYLRGTLASIVNAGKLALEAPGIPDDVAPIMASLGMSYIRFSDDASL
ncbi:hypothetical protein HWV62_22838 [Athelia sp. TMB]|nr:hypothetical protein HWV62_22838 [Athelia sp. TMB]